MKSSLLLSSVLVFVLSSLVSIPAFADSSSIREMYDALKQSGVDYTQTGVVCEQVARLELMRTFPPDQYIVLSGINYGNSARVIGELDEVVFRKVDRKVVMIGEVKCWHDLPDAHKKAMQQRARFFDTLHSGRSIEFYSHEGQGRFDQSQFSQVTKFISIAQQGGQSAGFEMSLQYSLDDLMQLRKWLMQCQQQGECRRPGGFH